MRIRLTLVVLLMAVSVRAADVCTAPVLTEYPRLIAATAGQPFFLCYFHAGTPPTSVQWYRGRSGDTSHPVAGAVAQCLATSVYGSVELWVRLVNECGTADSETIQVIVQSKPRAARH